MGIWDPIRCESVFSRRT